MMIKLVTPGSYDFGEPMSQQIKIARSGLHGDDLKQLVKRAGNDVMHLLHSLRFAPGEIPVHVIALGCTESFGPNRNGDGFKAACCRKYHDTFVKHAHWFRNHRNKDKERSYGIIKASAFNEAMGRIELIAALNGTKEAAERNGGLVADEEMEKLARREPFDVSMAAAVPEDVCSSCGNHAKSRNDYCSEAMCKHGGLRHNIGKVFEDGHVLHADNPDPQWFDLSSVVRRADRIAMVLGRADEKMAMCKAASSHSTGGAELAELAGVTYPMWMRFEGPWDDPRIVGQLKIASRLIDREQAPAMEACSSAFSDEVQPVCPETADLRKSGIKLGHALAALAELDCLLPPHDFLQLVHGKSVEKTAVDAVCGQLGSVFDALSGMPDLELRLQSSPYLPEYLTTEAARSWAQKQASAWSLSRPLLVERLQLSVLRQAKPRPPRHKQASGNTAAAAGLAREYALYQLGFLYAKQGSADLDYLEDMVVAANRSR
jgi:hypothetical protein